MGNVFKRTTVILTGDNPQNPSTILKGLFFCEKCLEKRKIKVAIKSLMTYLYAV